MKISAATITEALCLPADARVGKRISKTLLVEKGAPTAGDKRQINEGIEEFSWLATLKPATIGVPTYRDEIREYLEIAVLSLAVRPEAKGNRISELIHRSIPYPVFLILSQSGALMLSLGHLRWSQGQPGQMVIDGPLVRVTVDDGLSSAEAFLASLAITAQPRQNLHAFYQGWIERFEAYAASRLTGKFTVARDAATAERRRSALAEHDRLTKEIASLRGRAVKETQLNRRVELNLQLKQLESRLAEALNHF